MEKFGIEVIKEQIGRETYYHVEDGVQCVPFEDLKLTTLDRIRECSPVHICNSDENASENSLLYKTNIFVGGGKLS